MDLRRRADCGASLCIDILAVEYCQLLDIKKGDDAIQQTVPLNESPALVSAMLTNQCEGKSTLSPTKSLFFPFFAFLPSIIYKGPEAFTAHSCYHHPWMTV